MDWRKKLEVACENCGLALTDKEKGKLERKIEEAAYVYMQHNPDEALEAFLNSLGIRDFPSLFSEFFKKRD